MLVESWKIGSSVVVGLRTHSQQIAIHGPICYASVDSTLKLLCTRSISVSTAVRSRIRKVRAVVIINIPRFCDQSGLYILTVLSGFQGTTAKSSFWPFCLFVYSRYHWALQFFLVLYTMARKWRQRKDGGRRETGFFCFKHASFCSA